MSTVPRLSTSDDNALMKQVQSTHAPDGREFAVKPLLYIIEDIFRRAASSDPGFPQGTPQLDVFDFQAGFFDMLNLLSPSINKVSSKISSDCSGGGDAHETTLEIFNILTSYAWDAKVVLAMAAFALNCGEFGVVQAQPYTSNPIAKSVALLKTSQEMLERVNILKQNFEAHSNLIKAMLDLTKCIITIVEIPSVYITRYIPEMLTAIDYIPTAVYWIIWSTVACSTQILGLSDTGHEHIAPITEAWEPSSLAHKINSIYNHLMKQLQLIVEKRQIVEYQFLERLMETPHWDSMKVLRTLISAGDDQLPLIDGSSRKRVSIGLLRRKIVLLVISDLYVSYEELIALEQMYLESRQNPTRTESQYEVVWLPVVQRSTSWTEEEQDKFEYLQMKMPWYSVLHPSMIDPAVIRYSKEKWGFKQAPILVVVDFQGKVVNENAFHMLLIWGSLAFPFTSDREQALWNEASWGIELLADAIDPLIPKWVSEEKYICLYGGEDMEWIRRFTITAPAVSQDAGIPLEILYVGKRNPNENVRINIDKITREKLSYTLQELAMVSFFWKRLESIWHSKAKFGKTDENDVIMREIATMLFSGGSDRGWAVICKGSELARAEADPILLCLNNYDAWKTRVDKKGFVGALNDFLQEIHSPKEINMHNNRLILPDSVNPERVVCSECGRTMEKYIMFRCSTDI